VADDLTSAIAALDEAENVVPLTEDPVYFGGLLSYARACVWGDSTCGEWDEALRNLDVCEEILERLDVPRWRGARHLRAAILIRRGDYSEAAALYEELLADALDDRSRAALSSDLADCYRRMGRPAEALLLLDMALAVFLKRAETLPWARTLWARGDVSAALGEHDEAIRILTTASQFFASAGLNDDELGVELSIIQALRERDASTDVTPRLEQAYLLASALDAQEPYRSGARRAAVWAELCVAYRDGSLTTDVLAQAAYRLRSELEAENRRAAQVD